MLHSVAVFPYTVLGIIGVSASIVVGRTELVLPRQSSGALIGSAALL
jgi:hypothetical protein